MRSDERKMLGELILKANLDDQQFVVLAKRYGLDEQEPLRAFQIAQILGISVDQVRKLTRIALFKVREVSTDKQRFDEMLVKVLTPIRPGS
jgi:DNA-directed RNA polymerase sigma subunit (sigma70/sigma32)